MRALVQRVSSASVSSNGDLIGNIGAGLVVLLGISKKDSPKEARYIVDKISTLRVFKDENGLFNNSAIDTHAELLIISQFTLYADTRKGRRPNFVEAAPAAIAIKLFNMTVAMFHETGLTVKTGRFQAHMSVSIENDGPVTLMIDSDDLHRSRRS